MIIAQEGYHTLVAEELGRVVGMTGVRLTGSWYEKNGNDGQIMAMVVEQESRRQGVGTALMAAGEHWLYEHNARSIYLFSTATRVAAHRFYAQLGYQQSRRDHLFLKAADYWGLS